MRRDVSAFTRIELAVVVVIVVGWTSILLPRLVLKGRSSKIPPYNCVENLKEIGTAYRLWAGDNDNHIPADQTVAKGGWGDYLTNIDQGALCWTNYLIMHNELGEYPKLLLCPKDERKPATNLTTDFKDNTHISYFVGVSASDIYPQSIQAGDRNLGPGKVPDSDYGYSPTNGKGNDVAVPISGPVSWSLKMHSAGNASGYGNILLGDGSAQMTSSAAFIQTWLSRANPTTNWPAGHVPSSPSIRLVFP